MRATRTSLILRDHVKNPYCHVCKTDIKDEIHRLILFMDENKEPVTMRFHYFYLCWDMNYLCQEYNTLQLVMAGFVCDKKIQENPALINNLSHNLNLWV